MQYLRKKFKNVEMYKFDFEMSEGDVRGINVQEKVKTVKELIKQITK